MVNVRVMNTSKALRRRQRTTAAERAQILVTFERSGLSAAAFARQHGLHYTTFCAWRRQQVPISPAFVQIEVVAPRAPVELVVGNRVRAPECSSRGCPKSNRRSGGSAKSTQPPPVITTIWAPPTEPSKIDRPSFRLTSQATRHFAGP